MKSNDIHNLKEAFDESCSAMDNLEKALYPYRHLKQLIPKPISQLSASQKMCIARDIIKLKEE